MKIIINDLPQFRETYEQIFRLKAYERNELIFLSSFQECKEFIANYLEKQKLHIDLIITNETSYKNHDSLKATELCAIKNTRVDSFSHNNFRICSIPIILYSDNNNGFSSHDFDAIIQKNNEGQHDYFVDQCESIIRNWRKSVFDDLENLKIRNLDLLDFHISLFYKTNYKQNIASKAEEYFAHKTKVFSLEFIRMPNKLNYDWLLLTDKNIEKSINDFVNTYKMHVKYDRKNNERTVLHSFFIENERILLRDAYSSMLHEKNLRELNQKNSEKCDFILKTEYPDFLHTTFFEVKKEDVPFFVGRNSKHPRFSAELNKYLHQLDNYKMFAEDPLNKEEISDKIKYPTKNFDYVLLAGRSEEKEEMKEHFDKLLSRRYKGIEVQTFEELEVLNSQHLEKFNRLSI